MRQAPLNLVFVGLSLSSSWGNGHATTYRALLSGLHRLGHRAHFLERDVAWYREHRDLVAPEFCSLNLYEDLDELERILDALGDADAVVLGSYVPEGSAVADMLIRRRPSRLCYYDIDTPVTLANLDRGEEEYLRKAQISCFDVYFSFSGGTILDRLERFYGAQQARALYCSVDPELYCPTGEAIAWDLGYLGTYSDDRQPGLDRLLIEPARRLPHLSFVVAGSRYPDSIEWPANVERIEHLPPADHASFYSRQRFTLNVTREDMVASGFSPSVRLFEAAACGTPIISDPWEGLSSLLPERDAMLFAASTQDLMEHLACIDASERTRISRNARDRILEAHTASVRAGELVAALKGVTPKHACASSIRSAGAAQVQAAGPVPARARFP